jgi:hypothetical protein
MLGRLWKVEDQRRAARTVEAFGWLLSVEAIVIVGAPHGVASALQLPPLLEQGAGYFRLTGLFVGALGMLYVVSGRLSAEGFVFASLLHRPLAPPVLATLWYVNLIPGPLALAFALQDLAGFLWTLATSRADVRVPATVDALAGTVSGDLDNPSIRATELIYVASMLEQAKMFEAVDRLVQLFESGRLPIGRGLATGKISTYAKAMTLRMSERERRAVYRRVLGMDADGDDTSNRDFNDLWLRFLSAVAPFARAGAGAVDSSALSQEEIRKGGRDLAANLSRHGYGMAYVEARELQGQIRDMMDIMSDREILSAYGARDLWQVIDSLASREFGAAGKSARYRRMSTSGATVMAWLATKSDELSLGSLRPVLNVDEIQRHVTRGADVTAAPSDYDLITAVDEWLKQSLEGG